MPPIQLTNTATRSKETFTPADPNRVTMYVCGPTVYSFAHIGNARPAVVFDTLYRLLRHVYGAEHVVYARNFTDIDDKIIKAAQASGEPIDAITEKFARIYLDDTAALNVLPPDIQPRATEHVGDMIDMIRTLETKGHAYKNASGVNFYVPSMAEYGKLAQRDRDDMIAGARVDPAEDKKDPADFALWKAAKPGEPFWQSPWGDGRPGWHIECSAMIKAKLGETIDIHGGGIDLTFPHHENELAQSECANGKPLAKMWLHNGFLNVNAEKMSKSIGNVLLVHELLKEMPGEVIRFALLSGHYRQPLDWTDSLIDQSRKSLDRLYRALERVQSTPAAPNAEPSAAFLEALSDDLNTPRAFAELFALAGELNKAEDAQEIARLKGQLLAAGALTGLLMQNPSEWLGATGDDPDADKINALIANRVAARASKNWAEADRIRQVLTDMGVVVMDNPTGATWRRAT
jgi:cysteinyl-tRNA synthetase